MKKAFFLFLLSVSLFLPGCVGFYTVSVKDATGALVREIAGGEVEYYDAILMIRNTAFLPANALVRNHTFVILPGAEIEIGINLSLIRNSRVSSFEIPVAFTPAPSKRGSQYKGAKKIWRINSYNPTLSNDIWLLEWVEGRGFEIITQPH